MSIKDDWDKGTKFEKHFNNLADKAYPLVGELRRVAIYRCSPWRANSEGL